MQTAKENGLQPFGFLKYLFEQLPNIDTSNVEAVDKLLPWFSAIPDHCQSPVFIAHEK
ncbi:transposase domain-containing protein [Aquibacillus albus]|uniref:transposase domain-containing protein n=1 Tax=Aquibacillus albus TaxID=1168171 RepID=UPI0030844CB9